MNGSEPAFVVTADATALHGEADKSVQNGVYARGADLADPDALSPRLQDAIDAAATRLARAL